MVKLVVNNPKTRKSYSVEKDLPSLIGIKIGQKVDGGIIGLDGFTVQITGGSDKEGFPMRPEIEGSGRKKFLLSGPPGFNPKRRGQKKRKYIRGNTISQEIAQVNCKILEGEGDLEAILGKKEETKESEGSKEVTSADEKPKPAEEGKSGKETYTESKDDSKDEKPKPAEEGKSEKASDTEKEVSKKSKASDAEKKEKPKEEPLEKNETQKENLTEKDTSEKSSGTEEKE